MKKFFFIFISFCSFTVAPAQEPDYSLIFDRDWQKAEAFLSDNDLWIRETLKKHHVSYELAMAVVFPELVRYSALKDRIETTLLKTLYINLGDDYADFSIGHFQMKPSFAEAVRVKARVVMGRKAAGMFRDYRQQEGKKLRGTIVAELEEPSSQLKYLIAFIKICEKIYEGNWIDEESKIKFISTAYNAGPGGDAREIEQMTGRKFFNTKMFRTENYCYSDVALYWYRSRK